jgi:hypothetical protein
VLYFGHGVRVFEGWGCALGACVFTAGQ